MARRSRKRVNREVKQRRMYVSTINSIIRSEPVIRVVDRRRNYGIRRGNHLQKMSEGFRRLSQPAPGRAQRSMRNARLRKATQGVPGLYGKIHDCIFEWRKTLAWRSSQGAGRKRTQRELKNNKTSFMKNDC